MAITVARTAARYALALLIVASLMLAAIAAPAPAVQAAPASEFYVLHIVRWGENLTAIAARYGVSVQAIVQANRLLSPNRILVGQQLLIPVASSTYAQRAAGTPVAPTATVTPAPTDTPVSASTDSPVPTDTPTPTDTQAPTGTPTNTPVSEPTATPTDTPVSAPTEIVHVVKAGEYLARIAAQYGTTAADLVARNNLANPNLIYVGQKLRITGEALPKPTATTVAAPTAIVPADTSLAGRWIEVDLSDQALMCWEGTTLMRYVIVSTGLPYTPTLPGRFTIQTKYLSAPMSGPGYYLPAVPHTMYYYGGYSIHGAYWHNNFGQPMSHGCVNLPLDEAAWVYNFAAIGTPVVIHY